MPLLIYRNYKCKTIYWNYCAYQLSQFRSLRKFSFQDKINEEERATQQKEVMDKSKKHASFMSIGAVWESLFATPYKWCDLRVNKNAPDFKCIETGIELWIESDKTPIWVLSKLKTLGKEAFVPSPCTENLWKMLLADPSKWIDYRKIKKINMHPDFIHKDTREVLWIEASSWVIPMLNNLQDDTFAAFPSTENLWRVFCADPSEWFDNRERKRMKSYPDFVHKHTNEALWINDRKIPAWVLPKLNDVSSLLIGSRWRNFFADPSKWFDNRKSKSSSKHPDFQHRDTGKGLWIDGAKSPEWVKPMLKELRTEAFVPFEFTERLWTTFFLDPSKWFDNRKTKINNKFPDFKHKYNGEALWIDGITTPAWVLSKIKDLQHEEVAHLLATDNVWKTFFVDPSEWYDNRECKRCWNSPDFIHKHVHNGLWIDLDSTPNWVKTNLMELPKDAFVPLKTTWSAFLANPSKWFDERMTKKSPKAPDFRHKDTLKGLWIDCKSTPAWVIPFLSKLGNEAFASAENIDKDPEILFVDPSIWFDNRTER